MTKKIKVLVVDDSALIRRLLSDMLSSAPDIEVVGTAPDPYVAREKIRGLEPDVLTLDVEMPKMDGITFLRNLMRLRPMPVVMVSSLTEKGAEETMQALELGAVDFVTKPKIDIARSLQNYAEELVEKVRIASQARVSFRSHHDSPAECSRVSEQPATRGTSGFLRTTEKIIAIGASTGGTEAIKEVLLGLPPDCPGIVIAQHIPAGFSRAFADRMNRVTGLSVKEAAHGDLVIPGHAYIAPGDRHLMLARDGARYLCQLSDSEPVNRHRPSVDVLFRSVLRSAGPNSSAALLTGMGADGAQGLLELHSAGIHTIAQDEDTSVVWGMPGAAVKRGAVSQVLPLSKIAAALLQASTRSARSVTLSSGG